MSSVLMQSMAGHTHNSNNTSSMHRREIIENSCFKQKTCYVHTEVKLRSVNESNQKFGIEGRLHFIWVHNPHDSKGREVYHKDAKQLKGDDLLHYMQRKKGFEVENVFERAVFLRPLKDERVCMPLPTQGYKPIAIFEGLDGAVAVESTVWYPDNGIMHLTYKFSGNIEQAMNLQQFPFDRQALRLEIITRDDPPQSKFDPCGEKKHGLRLVVAPSEYLRVYFDRVLTQTSDKFYSPLSFSIQSKGCGDWKCGPSAEQIHAVDFSHEYSRHPVVLLPIERNVNAYLLKLFLPVFLIVACSFGAFVIDRDELYSRMMFTLLCTLVLFAFKSMVNSSLPKSTSTTFFDKYMLFALSIMCYSVMMHVIGYDQYIKSKTEDMGDFDTVTGVIGLVVWTLAHLVIVVMRQHDLMRFKWVDVIAEALRDSGINVEISKIAPLNKAAYTPVNRLQEFANQTRRVEPTEETTTLMSVAKQSRPSPTTLMSVAHESDDDDDRSSSALMSVARHERNSSSLLDVANEENGSTLMGIATGNRSSKSKHSNGPKKTSLMGVVTDDDNDDYAYINSSDDDKPSLLDVAKAKKSPKKGNSLMNVARGLN